MRVKFLLLAFSSLFIFPMYAWVSNPYEIYNTITNRTEENVLNEDSFYSYSSTLYEKINEKELDFDAFKYALKGYLNLQNDNDLINSKYLTIIDMSVSANDERFFIINMETFELEHKSLVAHGRNSGSKTATKFSNVVNSHQSSLGFYKTAETYFGKHGFSLRLDGLEFSNSNARDRAIVIHQADYVSYDYIKRNGRLGRSYGCPSLPEEDYKTIINKIKEGSCLFIYYPKNSYLEKSKLLNSTTDLVASID